MKAIGFDQLLYILPIQPQQINLNRPL